LGAWAQPLDSDSLLQAARQARQQNAFTDAMGHYFQLASEWGRNPGGNAQRLADLYEEIAGVYTQVGLHKKAIEYYEKSIAAQGTQVTAVEALGNAYFQLQEYEQSLVRYSQALSLRIWAGNRQAMLPVMERMVVCFSKTGQYQKALDNEFAILELCQALGDSGSVAASYNNIGYDYNFVGDYDLAMQYFQQALTLSTQMEMPLSMRASVLLNMGVVLQNKQDYTRAIRALLKAIYMVEASGDRKQAAVLYGVISEVYFSMGDYYNAELFNGQRLRTAGDPYHPKVLSEGYRMAFEIHQQQDEPAEALQAYQQHLELRDSIRLAERIEQEGVLQQQFAYERAEKEVRLLMADKERATIDAARRQLALEKQEQEIASLEKQRSLQEAKLVQQELERERERQSILLLQQRLAAQQQAQQLDELRRQEQLQRIELAKKEAEDQEKRAKIQRLEIQNRLQEEQTARQLEEAAAKQRFSLLGVAVGLVVLAFILWGYWISKRKNRALAAQQQLIKERNAELSQMNEELASQRDAVAAASEQLNLAYMQITDSVRYAQRIQQSILVPPAEIMAHFAEGFVLFRPREIVSGDFYWFAQVGQRLVVTAVDCTGHGVPGAFMSLIGNDLLNDIVNLRGITDPAEILCELSDGVRRTLKQEQTDNQDGMDMALCVVDREAGKLLFAGAKNPLVYMQHGEMHLIKGDKMAIGGRQLYDTQTYTTHEVPLDADTYFYIFSDGFQDQFGGPQNKKFMNKRLRQLLHDLHPRPMPEQEKLLRKALADWQGQEKQLDDILLMGFKIAAGDKKTS
jgi:serine phosphatase RsbU (regulator of sigma subunit)/tetratricopeptide (TPR) repeat protein